MSLKGRKASVVAAAVFMNLLPVFVHPLLIFLRQYNRDLFCLGGFVVSLILLEKMFLPSERKVILSFTISHTDPVTPFYIVTIRCWQGTLSNDRTINVSLCLSHHVAKLYRRISSHACKKSLNLDHYKMTDIPCPRVSTSIFVLQTAGLF